MVGSYKSGFSCAHPQKNRTPIAKIARKEVGNL
jgi:hypothetical protein